VTVIRYRTATVSFLQLLNLELYLSLILLKDLAKMYLSNLVFSGMSVAILSRSSTDLI
jgi:hypothetical protein